MTMSSLSLKDSLTSGLRRDGLQGINGRDLVECYGCRVTPAGLRPLDVFNTTVLAVPEAVTGYPQVFDGDSIFMLGKAFIRKTVVLNGTASTTTPVVYTCTKSAEKLSNPSVTSPEWTASNWSWDAVGGKFYHEPVTAGTLTLALTAVGAPVCAELVLSSVLSGRCRMVVNGVAGPWHYKSGTFRDLIVPSSTATCVIECSADFNGAVESASVKSYEAASINVSDQWVGDAQNGMAFFASCPSQSTGSLIFSYGSLLFLKTSFPVWALCLQGGRVITNGFIFGGAAVSNSVRWSTFGAEEFSISLLGLEDSEKPTLTELQEQPDFGIVEFGADENLTALGQLGDGFLAVTDKSTYYFQQIEDPPTYRVRKILPAGCVTKRGLISARDKCLLVSSHGDLYSITTDSVKNLGYRETFKDILSTSLQTAYDSSRDAFYIATNDYGFMLSPSGLSNTPSRVLFAIPVYTSSGLQICGYVNGIEEDNKFQVVSERMDAGTRGAKTISGILVRSEKPDYMTVALDYRLSGNDNWTRTSFFAVGADGVVQLRLTCVEFRVVVKAASYLNAHLDDVEIFFHTGDKVTVRGLV